MAARTSFTSGGTLESPDRHEGGTPWLCVRIKAFRNHGSHSCANWIRRYTRKLGWTVWEDLSSPWCMVFRGQQETWTYCKSHRGMLADLCWNSVCRAVR